jgi:3-deoxy-D-manno-octulosonic-acid transferase
LVGGNHGSNPVTEADLNGASWSLIYNALWYPALPFALAIAGGDAQNRRERLGNVLQSANDSGAQRVKVWLHAASVGEIEGVRPVVQSLIRVRRDLDFITTTMTFSGRDAARRRLQGACQLAPFDHPAVVRKFIMRVSPALVIISETEIWPNFLLQSGAAGARIAIINARLSARSMSRYRLIRPLLARALGSVSLVLAQTSIDADRFCTLGAAPERVVVAGNTKYEAGADSPPVRPALAAFAIGRPILVAGSTGPGEETIVLRAYRQLLQSFPSLVLILAPRHLNRVEEVVREVQRTGLAYTCASGLVSELAPGTSPDGFGADPRIGRDPISPPDQREARWGSPGGKRLNNGECIAEETSRRHPQILILDTMGELRGLYQRATVAFVGGSLTASRGGQSLAEPAHASVPVLFGPHYENHRQLGDTLIAARAGRVVRDAHQLAQTSAEWLANTAASIAAGKRAKSVMEQHAGSTAVAVSHLCKLLPAS